MLHPELAVLPHMCVYVYTILYCVYVHVCVCVYLIILTQIIYVYSHLPSVDYIESIQTTQTSEKLMLEQDTNKICGKTLSENQMNKKNYSAPKPFLTKTHLHDAPTNFVVVIVSV